MFNYFNVFDFTLFYNDKKLIDNIEKDFCSDLASKDVLNQIFLLSQENPKIQLNIEECKKLSSYAANYLMELIFNINQYYKKYTINNNWSIYKNEYILLTFDYHPTLVDKIKKLNSSKYLGGDKKEWIVHISEWRELQKIFKITNFKIEQLYLNWQIKNSKNLLIITEKSCQLLGKNLPLKELYYENSFEDITAKHTKSFKNQHWDGRIALFDINTRLFPIGVLPNILKTLNKYNIHYEIIDHRKLPHKKYNFQENVKLRDYQEYVVNKALERKSGILQLATGAGKTKISCSITSRLGLKTIFFVHTHFLLNQAKQEMENVLGIKIGQIGDGVIDIQNVTIAMIQTTMKALGEEYIPAIDDTNEDDFTDITGKENQIKQLLEEANVIFFDECQFVAAESFYTVANSCHAYYKYGLSATPYRSDKKDPMIIGALGPIIARVSASYLIKRGFLTIPKIHFFKNGQFNTNDKRKYQQIYKEDIVENKSRNEKIIFSAKKLMSQNKSVLILVQQINHGEILQKMFLDNGFEIEFVSGINDTKKREIEVKKLKNKQSLCLIASTIADEGLDIPSLDAVVLAGAGKSPSKELQRVGRALRKFTNENILMEIQNLLKQKETFFGIVCPEYWKEKIKTTCPNNNYQFIDKKNSNVDKYIIIDTENTDEYKKDVFEIKKIEQINSNLNGILFCKTKKDIDKILKQCKKINKTITVLNEKIEKVNTDLAIIKITDLKTEIIKARKEYKNIFIYDTVENNVQINKEIFFFKEKKEAYIIDFLDYSKYLSQHSAERYYMLKSEPEFIISGYAEE